MSIKSEAAVTMKKSGITQKIRKNRLQKIRTLVQILVTFIFSYGAFVWGESSNIYVPVFQCSLISSKTVSGICKTLTKGTVAFSRMQGSQILYLVLMLLSLFLLGKIWCGFLCPFGLFQDVLTFIRKKWKIHPIIIGRSGRIIYQLLKWILVLCLLFGIGFCSLCPVKYIMFPFAGLFPGFNLAGFIIAGIVVGFCFMKESAFCLICPLGTIMGLLNRFTAVKIKKRGEGCTHCRACTEVCPMYIDEIYQVRNNPDVTHPDCIYCLKCIDACPEEKVLAVTFFGKTIINSKREY